MKTEKPKRRKSRRPKSVTPTPAAPVPAPTPPPEPWWARYPLKLVPEPVLDPDDGQTLGYAVLVMHRDGYPAGVIAVMLPEGGKDVAHARYGARLASEKPHRLDSWKGAPEVLDYRDRPPFVPLPFDPAPFAHEGLLNSWWTGKLPFHPHNDLAGLARQMARAVWKSRPPTDPLSILLERAVREDVDDGVAPPLLLAHACAAFWHLPPEERRRLRNGWNYDVRDPMSSDETKESCEYASRLVLALAFREGKVEDSIEWAHTDVHERDPVRLLVMSDTPKDAAVAAVRAMLERLEKDWDELVVEKPDAG